MKCSREHNPHWIEQLTALYKSFPEARYFRAPVDRVAELYTHYPDANEAGIFCLVKSLNWLWTYDVRRRRWKPVDGSTAYDWWLTLPGNAGRPVSDFIESLRGHRGLSVYQQWLTLPGNAGKSVDEFFAFLTGDKGISTYQLWLTLPGNAGKPPSDFFDSLSGDSGLQGLQGAPGLNSAGEPLPQYGIPFFAQRPVYYDQATSSFFCMMTDVFGRILVYGNGGIAVLDRDTFVLTRLYEYPVRKVINADGVTYALLNGSTGASVFRLNPNPEALISSSGTGYYGGKATDGYLYFGVYNKGIYRLVGGVMVQTNKTNGDLMAMNICMGKTYFVASYRLFELDDDTGTLTQVLPDQYFQWPGHNELYYPDNGYIYATTGGTLCRMTDASGYWRIEYNTGLYARRATPVSPGKYIIIGYDGMYKFNSTPDTFDKISDYVATDYFRTSDGQLYFIPDQDVNPKRIIKYDAGSEAFSEVYVQNGYPGALGADYMDVMCEAPDGKLYLTAARDNVVQIWQLNEDGVFVRRLYNGRGDWLAVNPRGFKFL